MKIIKQLLPRITLQEFADQHNLTMEVHERSMQHRTDEQTRYWAKFSHAETKNGDILIGEFGNGATPEDAITDYGKNISEKLLVIDAYETSRREIRVPIIVPKPHPKNPTPQSEEPSS